ncbi:hypothetical protein KUTeg_015780 [Tegillarca granosa]|uniref:Uncharacterized protein n=1 Tax=Tegillarca granosa TaxID=220873 RepID=A0ABQ9ENA6_TEGGR|nr:hypothetical protein KUTeg_015780 [Tegillarca granosa]
MPENPDDFCVDAYESHEIDLPSDCIQEDTNSIKYNIGNCLPKACRKNNTNKKEKCSVDKKFCCSPSGREKRIIQCSGYSFPLYVTTSCECGDCEDIAITVHGQAIGETKGPLCFGTIQIEGETVGTTGLVGDFSFNIPRGVTRIAVKFIDNFLNTFLETLKVIELNEEIYGRIYVHVKMIEKATPIPINVSLSNTLELGNENGKKSIASITIKPNSIFFPNGSVYNGVAKASVNFFDPRNSSNIQNAPGEFISIDQEGQTQNLQTFGVFSLSLQEQSGSSLQIFGETEIELDQAYFKYASIENLTDAKLWGLNPETGIWEEQATLTVQKSRRKKRNGEFLVGTKQISARVMWNVNGLFDSTGCYFKTQVFEGDTKITNYNVRVIYRINRDIGNVIRYQELDVRSNEAVLVSCRNDGPLTVYIEVQKDGKKVLVDPLNSGLSSYVQSLIKYQFLEANRTVSAKERISTTGLFYNSLNANFQNVFRFKLDKKDYSMKVLNSGMIEAMKNRYPGNEVWYPPLNSYKQNQLEYIT